MTAQATTSRTLFLIAFMVLCNAIGNVLLKVGIRPAGEVTEFSPAALLAFAWQAGRSGAVWLAMLVLIVFLVCYLTLLNRADYSYVQPASAVGYAVLPLMAWALAGERMSPLRWIGVLLITTGVVLVSRTNVRTTGEA